MDDISSVWFRLKFPSSSSSHCTTVGEISYPIPPAIVMAIMTSTVKLVSLTHLRCSNFVRPTLIRICSRTIEGQETWKGCQPSFTLLSMISRTWTSSFVKFHGTLAINLSKPLALVSFFNGSSFSTWSSISPKAKVAWELRIFSKCCVRANYITRFPSGWLICLKIPKGSGKRIPHLRHAIFGPMYETPIEPINSCHGYPALLPASHQAWNQVWWPLQFIIKSEGLKKPPYPLKDRCLALPLGI